jgi:copper/silver efflux system protein
LSSSARSADACAADPAGGGPSADCAPSIDRAQAVWLDRLPSAVRGAFPRLAWHGRALSVVVVAAGAGVGAAGRGARPGAQFGLHGPGDRHADGRVLLVLRFYRRGSWLGVGAQTAYLAMPLFLLLGRVRLAGLRPRVRPCPASLETIGLDARIRPPLAPVGLAAHEFPGLGREFMPPLDEGTFLWMPTTMPHASLGEVLEVMQYQDQAIASVPEVDLVVGKLGRAESALDPAPISMIETVIHYKPEYALDEAGGAFASATTGKTASSCATPRRTDPDRRGRPFRQWRDSHPHAQRHLGRDRQGGAIPGTTSAPKLQPIETRLVMLQTGMRAPMGLKLRAPDLDTLDRMAVELERHLRQAPGVRAETVNAERVVGKPYLEIAIDREAVSRYGLNVVDVQDDLAAARAACP